MSYYDCESQFCFFYDKGRYFCNCRRAHDLGSAAFVQQCRANRKLLNYNKKMETKDLKDNKNEKTF